MPYTVPNRDVALAANPQSLLFQTDFDALVAGIKDTGVLSGCAVTAQGAPDLTLAVAAGFVVSGGVKQTVAAGNVAIVVGDGTNPRVDLVYASAAGVKAVRTGVAASNPKSPALNAGESLLAMVYVPAGDTAISDNQVTDKRVFVSQHGSDQHLAEAWVAYAPALDQGGAVAATVSWARRYVLGKTCVVQVGLTVTGAGTGGQAVSVTLPFNSARTGASAIAGVFQWFDASAGTYYNGAAIPYLTTAVFGMSPGAAAGFMGQALPAVALAAGDVVSFVLTYEMA